MCGFSFCISKNKISINEIKSMNDKIYHRGPDKEKFINSLKLRNLKKNKIRFCAGFRRLKIIDLSNKANQPMFYNDRYLIVFNGEIYNFIELKKTLIEKNYKFKTKSDTEVILAAYDYWGEKCFNQFNGMWALIIFDFKKNKLIVCRDRYGVKPLYYTKINKNFYFASEIKQLLILRKKNLLNKDTLSTYLYENFYSDNYQTFIKDIYQVLPGQFLTIDNDNFFLKKKKWYRFPNKKIRKNKINKIIKYNLEKAVKIRLRSDVKLGISLSGGIDSTTIASLVANIKKKTYKQIYTFSTCSNDKNDEYEYVKEFNKLYKFKNIKIDLKFKNFKKDFVKLVKQHDNPIPNLSIFSEWEIFRNLKKKKVTVNLDGHGADEQLCGYEKYFSLYLKNLLKKFRFIKFLTFFTEIFNSNLQNKKTFCVKVLINLLPIKIISLIKKISNYGINESWIRLKKRDKNFPLFFHNSVLNENFVQFFYSSLPMQLNWSDINSMSHSIETRSPFLDFNFVERILPTKMENKISGIKSKFILRETFKTIIPKKIYNRNFKVGFVAPGEKWTKKNKNYIEKIFIHYFSYIKEILNSDCKNEALKIIRGENSYREWIWKVIFLGAWIKYHKIRL